MVYKISFIDDMDQEFMGTTEHFSTDGRYSFNTIKEIAFNARNNSLKKHLIKGYVIRKYSFNNNVIKVVEF